VRPTGQSTNQQQDQNNQQNGSQAHDVLLEFIFNNTTTEARFKRAVRKSAETITEEARQSGVTMPRHAGHEFMFVKYDAHAFIGKNDRIGRLAIPAAPENKFDDAFATSGSDRVENPIPCFA